MQSLRTFWRVSNIVSGLKPVIEPTGPVLHGHQGLVRLQLLQKLKLHLRISVEVGHLQILRK